MKRPPIDDAGATDPVERLLEESWTSRSRRPSRRELVVECSAAILFFAAAIPLALLVPSGRPFDPLLAVTLVVLYALAARMVKFPIGAGYVVPSYLVLVPMLLLLPPRLVPLLAAGGLALGTLGNVGLARDELERVPLSIADAWHVLGPAGVLVAAGHVDGTLKALVYVAAFASGCLIDLVSATVRESAILGVRPQLQVRVIAQVWLIDACVAPLGLLIARSAQVSPGEVFLVLPLIALLLLASRDRSARIERAQRRLELLARERSRLQAAVRRLGEALAAKLDLGALTDILLRGSVEALDADAGRLTLTGAIGEDQEREVKVDATPEVADALRTAAALAQREGRSCQLERSGAWALALPFGFSHQGGPVHGALAVARRERAFGTDEEAVVHGLVVRASQAAADIVAHQTLREQALTDSLTKLGNRRKLEADLEERLPAASEAKPLVLIIFDLDGFKSYNDTFGHLAGDALLARLGKKLVAATKGAAYRLGGDEFCVLQDVDPTQLEGIVGRAAAALEEHGENFAVGSSYGAVLLPHEATTLDYALQLADERMYAIKKGRPSLVGDQTRDVLLRIMQARQPSLEDHSNQVAELCLRVGRRLGMSSEELKELVRAAELHDIGKVGIPDAILEKPAALDAAERRFMDQHTVLGERILSAAPALRSVAEVVRATHERWDGDGYPDGLSGTAIPIGARIIAACDAYNAMTTDRTYRGRMESRAACEELRSHAGGQFDPEVIDVLVPVLEAHGAAGAEAFGDQMLPVRPRGAGQPADAVVAYLREALLRRAAERAHPGGYRLARNRA